ncbi:MAG TPA: TIGR02281 family clan AA aspartic protease [Burkholderiales bacterium]|nr:TIGR02281 family clan AA aspartic protease [Burkholderiales bacterium]
MRHFICLSLLISAAAFAAGDDVALIGVIGDKAAVLAIAGGDPKTVKVGQTWSGVTVLTVTHEQATVEIEGKRRDLTLGQHYRGGGQVAATRESVTLAADPRGHFFADAAVNGIPMRFVVDTGATAVALSAADALRLGIDWRKGDRRTMQTANGATTGYLVKLDKVRVGGIELHDVDGVVLEQGLGVGLLGMSFLNRLDMRRDGDTMTLTRRF